MINTERSSKKEMAVARQIQVHAEEDGVVAVQRDVVVDLERGIVAELEKVVAAVDVGEGKIAVVEGTRVKAVKAIAAKPKPPSTSSPSTTTVTTAPSRTQPVRRTFSWTATSGSSCVEKLDMICIKKATVCGGAIAFLVVGAVLVGLAAYFLLSCEPLKQAGVTIIIIGNLTIVIALIHCTIFCYNEGRKMELFRYCSIGFLLAVTFIVAIAESVYVFSVYNSEKESADDCHSITLVLSVVLASVSYGILAVVLGFLCLRTVGMIAEQD